jgi:hypothetical protein
MFTITKRKGDRKSEVEGRMPCYLTVLAAAGFFFFCFKISSVEEEIRRRETKKKEIERKRNPI